MAVDVTPDDYVTRITEATPEDAQMVVNLMPLSMLRKVADLIYACEYPEDQSRSFRRKAILAEARGIEAEL
jgi:hypothetical protein